MVDKRPIGWEWAERYPHIYRDPPLGLQPEPCSVCGHATAACTQEDHDAMARTRKPEPKVEDVSEPVYVVLKEDVYEEITDVGATTKRQRLLYPRGAVVTQEQAAGVKAVAVQQQDIRGMETK